MLRCRVSDNCVFLLQAGTKQTIDCAQFMAWLAAEPQSIVWLPTLHRLAASEAGKSRFIDARRAFLQTPETFRIYFGCHVLRIL